MLYIFKNFFIFPSVMTNHSFFSLKKWVHLINKAMNKRIKMLQFQTKERKPHKLFLFLAIISSRAFPCLVFPSFPAQRTHWRNVWGCEVSSLCSPGNEVMTLLLFKDSELQAALEQFRSLGAPLLPQLHLCNIGAISFAVGTVKIMIWETILN